MAIWDHVSLKPLYCTLQTVVEQPNARSMLLKPNPSWLLSNVAAAEKLAKISENVVPIGVALGSGFKAKFTMPCAPFAVSAINRWNAVGPPIASTT